MFLHVVLMNKLVPINWNKLVNWNYFDEHIQFQLRALYDYYYYYYFIHTEIQVNLKKTVYFNTTRCFDQTI